MTGEIQFSEWVLGTILVAAFVFTVGGLVINGLRQTVARRLRTARRKRQWKGEEPMTTRSSR